jgi:hypothetical protein
MSITATISVVLGYFLLQGIASLVRGDIETAIKCAIDAVFVSLGLFVTYYILTS